MGGEAALQYFEGIITAFVTAFERLRNLETRSSFFGPGEAAVESTHFRSPFSGM